MTDCCVTFNLRVMCSFYKFIITKIYYDLSECVRYQPSSKQPLLYREESLTGLERYEGEELIIEFSFLGGLTI